MSAWTTEEHNFAASEWLRGQSASQIASSLMGAFGVRRTRNSVIGRMNRNGIDGRCKPTKPERYRAPKVLKAPVVRAVPKTRPPKPGQQNRPALTHGVGFAFTDSAEVAEAHRQRVRRDGKTAVEFVESGAGVESLNARPFFEGSGCKWPLADGMRCCNQIARGPYCEGHGAVSYIPRPVERRTVASAASWLTRFDRTESRPRAANDSKPVPSLWDEGRAA
jgi:hypothetical protein